MTPARRRPKWYGSLSTSTRDVGQVDLERRVVGDEDGSLEGAARERGLDGVEGGGAQGGADEVFGGAFAEPAEEDDERGRPVIGALASDGQFDGLHADAGHEDIDLAAAAEFGAGEEDGGGAGGDAEAQRVFDATAAAEREDNAGEECVA